MPYGDFKDLTRRTASDKVLRDKAFNVAKNPACDEYQHGPTSMVCKFFGKKSPSLARSDTLQSETLSTRHKSASGSGTKNENISSKELAEELHKPIIKKFEKKKITLNFYRQYLGC